MNYPKQVLPLNHEFLHEAIERTEQLRGVITDDEALALAERNRQRADAVRERMGTSYVCHPSKRVVSERQTPVLNHSLLFTQKA